MYGVCPAVHKRALVLVLRDARRDALGLKGAELLRGRRIVLPEDGLPNADAVMERGVLLPLSHAIDDETLDFVLEQLTDFLATR